MFGVLNAYMHAYCCPYVHTLHVFPLSEVHSGLCVMYVTMNNYHKVDSLTNEKSMLPFSAMVMISKHSKIVY